MVSRPVDLCDGGSAVVASVHRRLRARIRPTAMRRIVVRALLLLASWAVGLLLAAWTVPGVSVSVSGFTLAVAVFAVTQAPLSFALSKLPHQYESLLLGTSGLALTIIALTFGAILPHGLTIHGLTSWLATTVAVWLTTTIGAITVPELLLPHPAGSA